MATRILLFLLLFISASSSVSESSGQLLTVFVDSVNGEDSQECLNSNSSKKACKSLSFVAENVTQKKFITIKIVSEWLNISKPTEFRHYSHLTINGSITTTLHCNASNAGLAFVCVEKLRIQSVTIDQCGAMRRTTSVDPHEPHKVQCQSIAVYILNSTDVTMLRVNVQSSNGTGLSMYDTNGTVNIELCNFNNNRVSESERGGGGLRIEFTICSPGVFGNCFGHNKRNSKSSYLIQSCNFTNNTANCPPDQHQFISPFRTTAIPRDGKGGGIYISLGDNAMDNDFNIMNCHFDNNSASFNSGGMLIEFLSSVCNNSISVCGTRFVNNSCFEQKMCCGGGLVVGFMFYPQTHVTGILPEGNIFTCDSCTFEYNSAHVGGGTGVLVTKDVAWNSSSSSITFTNCQWINNISPSGAAVFLSPNVWDYTTEGFLPVPLFVNCTFKSNSAFHHWPTFGKGLNVSSRGGGAIFSSQVKLQFSEKTFFEENDGSGLYLPNAVVEFLEGSNVTFIRNVGHNGGAIAMYGYSVIKIHNDSIFRFKNNRAYDRGGAIYSDITAALQPEYQACFIQVPSKHYFTKTNSKFMFEGNNARENGDSIFSTTFESCRLMCQNSTSISAADAIVFLDCIANFSFTCNTSQLATRPDHITLNSSVHIRPGVEYNIPLHVFDEENNTLSGIVYEASTVSHRITVDPAFSQVSNNIIMLRGHIGEKTELHLDTFDMSLSFDVVLIDCEPGYILNSTTLTCECRAQDYFGLVPACGQTLYLRHGYWMGFCSVKFNSNILCTTYCPYGFCSYHKMNPEKSIHPLPANSRELEQYICDPQRHGRVCSRCTENHSVYYHSWRYTCGHENYCRYGWIFYLISEILPLTILYVIILFFNISVTNGNLNSFVFFAQILDTLSTSANGSIEFPYFITVIQAIQSLIYSPFNLNFFNLEKLSFCLWKGANVVDVLIMKYVTVGFALLLVIVTISLARCRCSKTFVIFARFTTPHSVLIHGISAFITLCYSQVVHLTFHFTTYFCLYSTNFDCKEKVINYMGYMNYLQGDHVKYAIIALFVFIFFILIPPLLLLLYPLLFNILSLCKLSESTLVVMLWRAMPIQLLDSFQSSFKDQFRFFAGLYFFYRIIVCSAFAYTTTLLHFYAIIQLQLIAILALHSLFQPHKERKHNIIDSLLFTNLAVINGITFFIYAERDINGLHVSDIVMKVMSSFQAFLIFLPLICVIKPGIMKLKRLKIGLKNLDDSLPSLRSGEAESLIQRRRLTSYSM